MRAGDSSFTILQQLWDDQLVALQPAQGANGALTVILEEGLQIERRGLRALKFILCASLKILDRV